MAGVRSQAQAQVTERSGPCTFEDHERDSESSQPSANVSEDTCLIVASMKPQVCPALLLPKFLADTVSSQECSQMPTSSVRVASSQQPSAELLMSLGIKVRDFAYESTLPAIVPVPRVPRQVQPAPRPRKRTQRDWDDEATQLYSGKQGTKRPRSLERKATEPVEESVLAVQHSRTLDRITVRGLRSMISTSTPPRARLAAGRGPSTSPVTPPYSDLASQGTDLVQTPSEFPFAAIHVTRFTMDLHPSGDPSASSSQHVSSVPPIGPFLEIPPSMKELGTDRDVRKRRGCGRGMVDPTATNRYQLRQRPIPSSRTSPRSHPGSSPSKSHARRTRRVR